MTKTKRLGIVLAVLLGICMVFSGTFISNAADGDDLTGSGTNDPTTITTQVDSEIGILGVESSLPLKGTQNNGALKAQTDPKGEAVDTGILAFATQGSWKMVLTATDLASAGTPAHKILFATNASDGVYGGSTTKYGTLDDFLPNRYAIKMSSIAVTGGAVANTNYFDSGYQGGTAGSALTVATQSNAGSMSMTANYGVKIDEVTVPHTDYTGTVIYDILATA